MIQEGENQTRTINNQYECTKKKCLLQASPLLAFASAGLTFSRYLSIRFNNYKKSLNNFVWPQSIFLIFLTLYLCVSSWMHACEPCGYRYPWMTEERSPGTGCGSESSNVGSRNQSSVICKKPKYFKGLALSQLSNLIRKTYCLEYLFFWPCNIKAPNFLGP